MAIYTNPVATRSGLSGLFFAQTTWEDRDKPLFEGPSIFNSIRLTPTGRKYARESYGGPRRAEFNHVETEMEVVVNTPTEYKRYETSIFQASIDIGLYRMYNIDHNPWTGVTFQMKRKMRRTVYTNILGGPPPTIYESFYYEYTSYSFSNANNPVALGPSPYDPANLYESSLKVTGPTQLSLSISGDRNSTENGTRVTYESNSSVPEQVGSILYPAGWYIYRVDMPPFYLQY